MRKRRLSSAKQAWLIEYFLLGTTAQTTVALVGVNENTAAYYFQGLRVIITQTLAEEMPLTGAIEVDESYFGGCRQEKYGPRAAGKVLVFGILKRGARVYTKVIFDTKAKTLVGIMPDRIVPDSIVYTDTYRSCNVLDVSEFNHYRINHFRRFVKKHKHTNGIENFWNQAKRHFRKFNGVPWQQFNLLLKECEWRFNTPNPQRQLIQLKRRVKHSMN